MLKLISCLTIFCGLVFGAKLEKIEFNCENEDTELLIYFQQDSASDKIPKFLQKYDQDAQTFTLQFLNTGTSLFPGEFHVTEENLFISRINIKQIELQKGSSIYPFLSIVFSAKPKLNKDRYPAIKKSKRVVSFSLGRSLSPCLKWVINKQSKNSSSMTAQIKEPKIQKAILNKKPEQADTSIILEDLGTESALDIGQKLDTQKVRQAISSSKTFSVTGGGKRLVVLNDEVNMRESPNTSSNIIHKMEIGSEVLRLEKIKGWYKVEFQNDTGYISERILAYIDELTDPQLKKIQEVLAQKKELTAQAEREAIEKQQALEEAKAKKEEQEALRLKMEQENAANAATLAAEEAKEIQQAKLLKEQEEAYQAKEAKQKTIEENQRIKEVSKKEEREQLARLEEEKKLKEEKDRLEKEQKERDRQQQEAEFRRQREEKLKKEFALKEELAEQERLEREQAKARVLAENKIKAEMELKLKKESRKEIGYNSFGRRDPFLPIIESELSDNELDIDQMKLVGIIWDDQFPLAVLEHRKQTGISLALKIGDRIPNGKVMRITRSTIQFEISEYGVARTYTLKLVSPEERTAR